MHILIIGAAGMIGRKLTDRHLKDRHIGEHEITALTLADVVSPERPKGFGGKMETAVVDLSAHGAAEGLVASRPDIVVHLAAIVSGEAEADFERGYRINLEGTQRLFEAIRAVRDGYKPKLVFTSSTAEFGAPLADKIADGVFHTPVTSYG